MSTWKYAPGDKVTIAPFATKFAGTHWIVQAQPRGGNGKNYTLAPLTNPTGRPLRAPESLLTDYTGETVGAVVQEVPFLPEPGTVVTLNIPGKVHPDTLWVVTADSGATRSRVSPLGGGDTGWKVGPWAMTVVPPAELAAALPAHLAATTK